MTLNEPVLSEPGGTSLDPIRPLSLPQMVADRIVEAIGDRRILSGQRVFELELAEQMAVSRVPVREALRVLESQGLVRAQPRRGVHVIDLDERWAMEIYDTRAALETVGAQRTAQNIRRHPPLAARLDEALAAIERAALKQDRIEINRADLAFHTQIYALSDSPLLQTLWAAMARHVLIMFGITTFRRTDFDYIIEEHRRLRRVLDQGSTEEIAAEIPVHIVGPHKSREAAAAHWAGQARGTIQA
ncbi:GntR family transcriptional regulator [Taklimakanibacter deserti]|uniref:GntR family transcriptional regulator n=1 Tax=Taklimakanibacter deserti TaxID=2267839 RepID=UPI000E65272F